MIRTVDAEYETIALELRDGVLIVTLNRPDLNAFTITMADELEHLFRAVNDDDDVNAVVVTGSGRAFCAGMDLTTDGNVFGLDETLQPTSTIWVTCRTRSLPAASATPVVGSHLRCSTASTRDRRRQRPRCGHRSHPDLVHGCPTHFHSSTIRICLRTPRDHTRSSLDLVPDEDRRTRYRARPRVLRRHPRRGRRGRDRPGSLDRLAGRTSRCGACTGTSLHSRSVACRNRPDPADDVPQRASRSPRRSSPRRLTRHVLHQYRRWKRRCPSIPREEEAPVQGTCFHRVPDFYTDWIER